MLERMGRRLATGAAESIDPNERDAAMVVDGLRRIVRALRHSARLAEQRLGVSSAQLVVLQEVAAAEGCSINDLAARTCTDQSSVSLVVTRLERTGYVERRASSADGRRTEVLLTRAGRGLLGRAPEVTRVRLLAGLARLAPSRRKALGTLLAELVNAIETTAAVPPMLAGPARGRRLRA